MTDKGPYIQFIGIGLEIVVLVILAVWIGDWLDSKLDGHGLWMGLSVILALVLWFIHLIFMMKRSK